MSFTGTWSVASSPDFDEDSLTEAGDPYVTLRQRSDRVEGRYQIGLMNGDIDGRLDGNDHALFSFEGMDELEEVNGAGTVTLQGDRLKFTLMYHQGDTWTFECERRP